MGGEVIRNFAIDDVVFQPDGSQVLVCTGKRIMIYNVTNGELINTLDGHEDQIQSLSCAVDGCYFASGGADRCVLVWTSMGKIIQRYSHDDSVLKVLFNPVNVALASCSTMDIGIWSLDSQDVVKFKTSSNVLSIAWSKDGEILALGMKSGQLSLRNRKGNEISLVCCGGTVARANIIEKPTSTEMRVGNGKRMTAEEVSGSCIYDVVGHAPLLLERSYNVAQSTNSHVKAGDYEELLHMLMSKQEFEKASDIFKKHVEDISKTCKVHYADWLLSHGSQEEALHVLRLCLEAEKYLDVVEKLASCSVKLGTYFNDVSYYFLLLGKDLGQRDLEGIDGSRSASYIQASHLYFAYHMIHEYCDNPFTLAQPEVLLRASLFLLNSLAEIPAPAGISRAKILYSLLQQGLGLKLYDVARYAYSQLQTIKCSQIWDNSIELGYMMLQAAETRTESDTMHVVCYKCGASNPLLNLSDNSKTKGDRCVKCYHAFKRCFLTFTILPLAEINPGNVNDPRFMTKQDRLKADHHITMLSDTHDFSQFVLKAPDNEQGTKPIIVNESLPRHCDEGVTFAVNTPKRMYFQNVNPEICVTLGPSNGYGCFFLSTEWELEVLKSGKCPFSRVQVNLHYPSLPHTS